MRVKELIVRTALSTVAARSLTILIYHRVNRTTDELFQSVPDAARFERQMAWYASVLNIVPLLDAIEMLRHRRLPPRAAAITFDDGYADNAEIALPILRRHRLHATFFVASGFLDGGRMWNDTIIESIRRAPGNVLDLTDIGLGPLPITSPVERRASIDRLIAHAKYMSQDVRRDLVQAIAAKAGVALPNDLMMRSDQLLTLSRAGMTVGAHTVSHPILARLKMHEARTEVVEGRQALESLLGAKVSLFAYPNGKPGVDYTPEHAKMVRELGFSAALSTRPVPADARSDLYELPRFTPWGRNEVAAGTDLVRKHVRNRMGV